MFHIGVDAGATKTHAAIMNRNRTILYEVSTGPGNMAVDFFEAEKHIEKAIAKCLEFNGEYEYEYIVLGIAGIEKGNLKSEVAHTLKRKFALPVLVLNDAELAFYSLFQEKSGILAVAGTGSIVIGKHHEDFLVVGGWGHLVGDEGSAYDVGIQALKTLIREIDRGGVKSSLAKELVKTYQLHGTAHIKSFIYSSSKAEIAALANFVAQLADAGNGNALDILRQAGKRLSEQTSILARRLALQPPIFVGCRGSLLEKNDVVQNVFQKTLEGSFGECSLLFSEKPVITGAQSAWFAEKGEK